MGNYISAYDIKALAHVTYEDLGFNTDGDYESWLESVVVPAVERIVDDYCGEDSGYFASGGTIYTNERHDYNGGMIYLDHYPLISITKVEFNKVGYGLTEDWEEISSVYYFLYSSSGILKIVNKVPAIEERSVRVTYTAGYSSIPAAIEIACAQLGANLVHEILQRKISPVVRVDDFAIKMVVPEIFAKELKSMLKPYVRRRAATG